MKTSISRLCLWLAGIVVTVALSDVRGQTAPEDLLKQAESRLRAIYDRNEFLPKGFRADWLADSSGYIVLESAPDAKEKVRVRYNVDSGKRTALNDSEQKQSSITGKSSPDGARVVFSERGNLYVRNVNNDGEFSLTKNAPDGPVSNHDAVWGPDGKLPEYFRLATNADKKPEWTPISPKAVPAETKLSTLSFDRPAEPAAEPYTTPEEPDSCWKKPGPVAGPFQARLGDGSVVTYYWYRFAGQPALLNAGLTEEDRVQLQKRVEKIHRTWQKDRDYFAPPTVGTLVELDPALLVTPPKDMEVGYVPIATRQEWGGSAIQSCSH